MNDWNETHSRMTHTTQFGYPDNDTRSVLAVPLFGMNGSCFGMMSVQAYPADMYTAEHEQLLVTLASHVSKAIENANLFARARQELAERERAEQALAMAEEKYRSIFENALDGIYQSSPEGRFLTVNPAFARMLGYDSPQEMIDSVIDIADQIYENESQRLEFMRRMAENGQVSGFEYRMLRKDKSLVWASENARAIRGGDGGILYYEGMVEDVTERKQAEEKLRESETLYRRAIEVANAVPYRQSYHVHGKSVEYDFIGEGVRQITGYGPEEFGETLWDSLTQERILLDELAEYSFDEAIERVRSGLNPVWKCEHRIRARDGKIHWVFEAAVELRDTNGISHGSIGMFQDITERKQMEEALKQSESFNRSIIENEPECVKIIEAGGILKYMNPAGLAMIEVDSLDKVLGKSVLPIIVPEHRDAFMALTEKVLQGGQGTLLFEIIGLKGTRRWFDTHAVPLRDNQGKITSVLGITRDVTDRIKTEQQAMEQLNRINALHTIDTVIKSSVDLNNTLEIVLNQAATLLSADAACILLFNRETLTLNYAAGRGFRSTATQFTKLRPGEGFAGRILLDRRIIHISNLTKSESKLMLSLSLAGENFAAYIGVPLIAKGQIVGVLEIFQRSPLNPGQGWFDFLEMLSDQAAIAIDNAQLFEKLQRTNFELTLAYDDTIEGWSRALDLRDKETEGHTQRVTSLTLQLARQMGIPDSDILHIRRGALLHDIGKMGVPDHILFKQDKLTGEEWDIMRRHPAYAFDMLTRITYLRPALDIPYSHHEKWDGTGYPRGLKGEEIPLAARLFAVVDVWDALRTDRPYRKGWTAEETLDYINAQSGKHFDPQVVGAFLNMLGEMPGLS